MSDSKLTAADLAKLAEGATIYGPWRALENGIETGDRYDKQRGVAMWMDHGTPQDRALIVYLVNHVPAILALLGENERLREVERAAREAMPVIEQIMRKRYDEYVGEDVIDYLREHGKLVLDDSGKERPLIVAWKALDAALAPPAAPEKCGTNTNVEEEPRRTGVMTPERAEGLSKAGNPGPDGSIPSLHDSRCGTCGPFGGEGKLPACNPAVTMAGKGPPPHEGHDGIHSCYFVPCPTCRPGKETR